MRTTEPVVTSTHHRSLPAPPLPAADAAWALLLDVDGTLLDFVDDPSAVNVSAQLLALLQALHDALGGAMAVVSGRTLEDLDRLFKHAAWATVGQHGLELRRADGSHRQLAVNAEQQASMRAAVHALAGRLDGVQVEDKGVGIALHCRVAPQQLSALRAAATELAAQLGGYEAQFGNLVVEFKPSGIDKGRAVFELLQSDPFASRLPVYLGDDLTDEHAFARVNDGGGISVRVGMREPTLARFTLADPTAVGAWLTRVLSAFKEQAEC